ncbi:hypothetical protein B4Q13_20615, partial [Lacticaseibacillus rhamnosus]
TSRIVSLLPLAAAMLAGLSASPAQAAEPAVPSTPVGPPVTVTATRFDDAAARYPIGVSVITAQDIERSPAFTVPQLLQSLAGIRTRELSGSPNVQVDMRGFGIFGDQRQRIIRQGRDARRICPEHRTIMRGKGGERGGRRRADTSRLNRLSVSDRGDHHGLAREAA